MKADDLLKTKAGQNPVNRARIEEASRSIGKATARSIPPDGVAQLGHTERKPTALSTLDKNPPHKPRRKKCVAILVEIVSFRVRELDADNLVGGSKHLRDCIAHSLGVDDGDKRLRWRYRQVVTEGSTGTLVRIERIK